ncbi:MAG: UDP-N-acetylmuramoyl-L-alanine--D-glutamate ligase [Dysgonamonadaceae bacterium]|nr:UDP-N-acetylmuramoyl-L-alanine--D-glutamate ligase [Dysgonamonadaceae bacterium]
MINQSTHKKIVILGGGLSGVGAAILAKAKGFDVFLSDKGKLSDESLILLQKHTIDFEEGQHTLEKILQADEAIISPGIPYTATVVVELLKKEIPIISEIEFAARYTTAKTICITGSNGKTTTSSLLYHILKSAGLNVGLAGNVGTSFAKQVAEESHDYYILELSSFQLESMKEFKADIAVLLNITPDHLDRYNHNMQNYVDAKMRIVNNQTEEDVFIYWANDPVIKSEIEKIKPYFQLIPFAEAKAEGIQAYKEDAHIYIHVNNNTFRMKQDQLALQGTHNLYNSLAAGLVSKLLDISDDTLRQSLTDFKGVPHRLEKVATVRGVMYINDSKATNVNSCWYALQSMKSNVVLILGGTDKGNDYSEIEELVKKKVRALIFLGADNTALHNFFDGKIPLIMDANSMKTAVDLAYDVAQKGDVVLLSPCCASFDLFKNFEDRGDQFKECVRRL